MGNPRHVSNTYFVAYCFLLLLWQFWYVRYIITIWSLNTFLHWKMQYLYFGFLCILSPFLYRVFSLSHCKPMEIDIMVWVHTMAASSVTLQIWSFFFWSYAIGMLHLPFFLRRWGWTKRTSLRSPFSLCLCG